MKPAGTYEASKQGEPRNEAKDDPPTGGTTRRGGKQPTPTTGDCVFVSTCRERYRDDDTEAV